MKKKLSTILTVLMIAMFTISTADAGRGIKISSADFSLGSLITDGTLTGTDQSAITVVLEAKGSCTFIYEGSGTIPVSAIGFQFLGGEEESITENGTMQFHVETTVQDNLSSPFCDNDPEGDKNFIVWTSATISVFSGDPCGESCGLPFTPSTPLLVKQDYNCTTNQGPGTVACTPVKNSGSNNGTAICHATGSKKNPYVLLTVKVNALNGHSKHTGDIIPAPANGCPK